MIIYVNKGITIIVKKFLKYMAAVVPFFAAEGIQIIVVNIIALFYSILLGFKLGLEAGLKGTTDVTEAGKSIGDQLVISQDISYFISVFAIFVCGVVFFFWYRQITRWEVKGNYRKVFTRINITYLILLGVGCQLFTTGLMNLFLQLSEKLQSNYSKVMNNIMGGNIIMVVIAAVIIAPITEELIFRGVILKKTSRVIPFLGANLLQAAIFGIYHRNIVQGIYGFVLGLVLGYVAYKFKTVVASIVLHMIINASSFLLTVLPNSNLVYIALFMVGAGLMAISLLKIKVIAAQEEAVRDSNILPIN